MTIMYINNKSFFTTPPFPGQARRVHLCIALNSTVIPITISH